MVNISSGPTLKFKTDFSLSQQLSIVNSFFVGNGTFCPLPFSRILGFCLTRASTAPSSTDKVSASSYMCQPCSTRKTPNLWVLDSPFFFCRCLDFAGYRCSVQDSVTQSPSLSVLYPVCGLCVHYHLLQEASLMRVGQHSHLQV